jgi:hypothetical protein
LTASNGSITDTTTGSLDLVNDTFNTTHGVHLKAGTNITLVGDNFGTGGLSASAGGNLIENSANPLNLSGQVLKAGKQMVLSANTIDLGNAKLTAGSIQMSATSISNSSAHGSITAAAGTLHATHDISLVGENIVVNGTGPLISAASVDIDKAVVTGTGVLSVHATGNLDASGLRLNAGGFMAQGGSIDLTGLTANVTGQMALHAKQDIILSGVHITAGIFTASASGTIHNGGAQGAITAAGMKFDAKKNIDMSSTVLTIGTGAVTGVTGDAQMLQLLAALGLKPGSAAPNGAFLAGGSVTLGALNITGNYLVLQGSSVSILGPVTAPNSGLLVEVRPGDPAQGVDVEDQAASGANFNISNKAFLALFPGDTIVIGDDAETGAVTIGTDGPFILAGGTNLLFDTTGTITGLGNLTSTGLVGSLETVAASAGNNDVVTAGEIDPSTTTTTLGDQTDKKHLGHGGFGLGNGEGRNGNISTDTGDSSVCH